MAFWRGTALFGDSSHLMSWGHTLPVAQCSAPIPDHGRGHVALWQEVAPQANAPVATADQSATAEPIDLITSAGLPRQTARTTFRSIRGRLYPESGINLATESGK